MILPPGTTIIDPNDPRALNLQYNQVLKQLRDHGEWVYYERVNQECLVVTNTVLRYNLQYKLIKPGVHSIKIPLDTTRESFCLTAIKEKLGYNRGYNSAKQFRDELNVNTWNANANKNKSWLNNPHRKGEDDMGRVYGVQGRGWLAADGTKIDQLAKVLTNLKNGVDDRGEIVNFYNVGEFKMGCLRPCLYDYQYNLVNGKLSSMAKQRSCDFLLGGNFNGPQVASDLALVAIATGNIPTEAVHTISNVHIYKNQYDLFIESGHADREPFNDPTLIIDTTLPHTKGKTSIDLLLALDGRNFKFVNYKCHDRITYPLSE